MKVAINMGDHKRKKKKINMYEVCRYVGGDKQERQGDKAFKIIAFQPLPPCNDFTFESSEYSI